MSAKDNFNEAMFSMFGVGKDPAARGEPQAAAAPVQAPAPAQPAPAAKPEPKPAAPAPARSGEPRRPFYIAAGSAVEGKLTAKGDVEIAGQFKGELTAEGKVTICADVDSTVTAASLHLLGCRLTGDVHTTGTVVINETATILGNVFAGELICSGTIQGNLEIKGNVALDAKSNVAGDITAQTMSMSQGAVISGRLKLGGTSRAD